MTSSQEFSRTAAEQLPECVGNTLQEARTNLADMLSVARKRSEALDVAEDAIKSLWGSGVDCSIEQAGQCVTITLNLGSIWALSAPDHPKPTVERIDLRRKDPLPSKQKMATKPAKNIPEPKAIKTGPWGDAEGDRAVALHKAGKTNAEIAEALSRDVRGIAPKLRHMLTAKQRQPASAPAPARARTPGAAAQAPRPEADMSNGMSAAEREIRRRIRAIGYPVPWTPANDLKLVQALARGDGLSRFAASIGVETSLCKRRWNALLPDVTIEGQTQLLATLRALAGKTE